MAHNLLRVVTQTGNSGSGLSLTPVMEVVRQNRFRVHSTKQTCESNYNTKKQRYETGEGAKAKVTLVTTSPPLSQCELNQAFGRSCGVWCQPNTPST